MAEQHPIQGLMYSSMQSIKDMIDVNTIVGDAIETQDGTTVVPISKVSFGFGVGGSNLAEKSGRDSKSSDNGMFGGGSGAGVSITPVAFMVVGNGQIRLMHITNESNTIDKLIDAVPAAIDKITENVKKFKSKKRGGGTAPMYAQLDDIGAEAE